MASTNLATAVLTSPRLTAQSAHATEAADLRLSVSDGRRHHERCSASWAARNGIVNLSFAAGENDSNAAYSPLVCREHTWAALNVVGRWVG
jgi:hypothetical protein